MNISPCSLKNFTVLVFFCLFMDVVTAQAPSHDMVFVQSGKFKMGSLFGGADEQPVHEVVVADINLKT